MKHLNTYIEEQFNPAWDYVVEMTSIGYPVLNKTNHYIAVHGTNAGYRQRPHIHIYLSDDKRPFSKFNFEIALDEILCYDEINLIRMKDKAKHIDRRNINIEEKIGVAHIPIEVVTPNIINKVQLAQQLSRVQIVKQ